MTGILLKNMPLGIKTVFAYIYIALSDSKTLTTFNL